MLRFIFISVLCATLSAAAAGAQDRAADSLIDRGIRLFREGHYAAALETFEDAHRRSPTVRSTAQIGVTEHALGHYVRAYEMLRQALDSANDPWLTRARRQTIQEAFDATRAFVAEVEVRGDLGEAAETLTVFVNGERRGRCPLTQAVPVLAGRVEIELRAEGEAAPRVTRRVTVEPRTVTVVEFHAEDVTVVRNNTASPASASSSSQASALAADTATSNVPPDVPTDDAPSNGLTIAGWTAVGVGAVGLATGAVFHVLREQSVDDHNSRADCGTTLAVEGEGCAELRSEGTMRQSVMIAGYAVGGAALVAGIILLALPSSEPDDSSATVSCAPTFGAWGVGCHGTF
jgi:hypothetical protein